VADLGAGTGILSEDLLDFGARVIAVEPNEPMRMVAEEAFGERPGFFSMDGSAEATNLASGSVTGIVAAQAFHWFDPIKTRDEALRVGVEGAWAAIIWNSRQLERTPFARAYEAFCRTWGTDYAAVATRYVDATSLRTFFDATPRRASLDNAQELDREALKGRLLSCSYIPGPEAPEHAQMLDAIDEMFVDHESDGRVTLEYETEIYLGQLTGK
jgi:SAM-dependent methyltransferase